MYIDSHCHLDFYDKDEVDLIIENANKNKVEYFLNASSSMNSFDKIIEICDSHKNVYGAIGIHPHEAEDMNYALSTDELLLYINKSKKIIAIGETGLDYSRETINKNLQIENLLNHIYISQTTKLPLIIHNRNSNTDMINILTTEYKNKDFPCIIHCFTGDEFMAKSMMDLGFYISASGIITFKNSIELQNIFKNYIPMDRLLIETDSPYLAPTPYRGHRNEPMYIIEVARKIAEFKNITMEAVGNITTNNFKTLFNLNI